MDEYEWWLRDQLAQRIAEGGDWHLGSSAATIYPVSLGTGPAPVTITGGFPSTIRHLQQTTYIDLTAEPTYVPPAPVLIEIPPPKPPRRRWIGRMKDVLS